jgi:hypothetical protein
VLRDILDGLVAAGTLALAGVTGRLAFTTRGSVREAYRARIDAFGPRVVVRSFKVDRCPVKDQRVYAAYQDLDRLEPGTRWTLDSTGDRKLGIAASATVHNEGPWTTFVHVDHPADVELRRQLVPTQSDDKVEPRVDTFGTQNGDWYLLPSGERLPVDLVWWRTEREWLASARLEGDLPTVSVTLVVRDATGLAEDRCQLTFGFYVLWPSQMGTTWFVALRNEPIPVEGQPPPPIAEIGRLERNWPGEPTSSIQRWRQRKELR